jgi:hypothetical protein
MNPLIQLKQTGPAFLVPLLLACFGLLSPMQAVVPAPDGGYPGLNTAEGTNALFSLSTGQRNTALGAQALYHDINGGSNTAVGNNALFDNSAGNSNTAVGVSAAFHNTAGGFNTAVGTNALFHNTSGINNTAVGVNAAFSGSGNANTAVGMQALNNNTADGNSPLGFQAVSHNTIGHNDTAVGYQALLSNTGYSVNTAVGDIALRFNTTGTHNTACGAGALRNNSTGSFNIALGDFAGANFTTGGNNIEIGHPGFAAEHNTIRIGNGGTIGTFIDGIYAVSEPLPALAVYVNSGGQLGTQPPSSSRRFKQQIRPMDSVSEAVLALKPVTFQYKSDATNTPQFGLIAEEVADVNSDLVLRDKVGKPYTVRSEAVNAMLLNEFLKEHKAFVEQQRKVQDQEATITHLQKQIEALIAGLQKVNAEIEMSKTGRRIVLNDSLK